MFDVDDDDDYDDDGGDVGGDAVNIGCDGDDVGRDSDDVGDDGDDVGLDDDLGSRTSCLFTKCCEFDPGIMRDLKLVDLPYFICEPLITEQSITEKLEN